MLASRLGSIAMNRSSSLDLIEVVSPCPASWDEMKGDERVRFCQQCKLNVYNLSEMGREEAEAFVRKHTAGQANSGTGRTCVRFYRRADGTVLTKDCPVGVRALQQRFVRAVAAIAGVFVALVSGTLFGGVISRRIPTGLRTPAESFADWINPERRLLNISGAVTLPVLLTPAVMGGACAPPPGLLPAANSEPAETPLLAPTPEQIEQIQKRLER